MLVKPDAGLHKNVVWVPTDLITTGILLPRRFSWAEGCQIRDGDWDMSPRPLVEALDAIDMVQGWLRFGLPLTESRLFDRVKQMEKDGVRIRDGKTASRFAIREERKLQRLSAMKTEGYVARRGADPDDEVSIGIGRDGKIHYLLRGRGGHRLAFAKVLGLPYVACKVYVRHEQWRQFRSRMWRISARKRKGYGGYKNGTRGLYQQIQHPDIANFHHLYGIDRGKEILALAGEGATMIDIGCQAGLLCHVFEDAGWNCLGLEYDKDIIPLNQKIRDAMQRRYLLRQVDVLTVPGLQADVMLMLAVLHHLAARWDMLEAWLQSLCVKRLIVTLPSREELQRHTFYSIPEKAHSLVSDPDQWAEHLGKVLGLKAQPHGMDGVFRPGSPAGRPIYVLS
jgi:hypothetical protein